MKLGCALALSACAAVAHAAHVNPDQYSLSCHKVYSKITANALKEIEALKEKVEKGEVVPALGAKADEIMIQAMEVFNTQAAPTHEDKAIETIFEGKIDELEKTIDMPLQLVYMKQLALLREKALLRYKTAAKGSESSEYQAMQGADQFFAKEAEASVRQGSTWDWAKERTGLQALMAELAQRTKRASDAALKAAQQQSTAMQFLQHQQQQITSMQQQLYGGSSPWNFGVAYRIPDTYINLSGNYQQGRANVQLSCVRDDYAPLLGANGFEHGVGPGNLGLSVNLNI